VRILTLDPRATHVNNPDCPMRLVPAPNGGWMCIDCGFQLIMKAVEVEHLPEPDRTPKPGWWKDEKGNVRSPLDDPNCPFALESDDNPK